MGPPAALLHLVLLIVLVAGLVTYVPSATAAPAMSVDDELASFVDEYRKTQGLPGISYTVLDDGEVTASGGSGTLQADTPVPIASVSKPFTAFAVLQLVDDGDIRLDDPVTSVLPEFSVGGTDPDAITIRMLLSHTSGLPQPTILPETGSYTQSVANIADLSVVSAPGTTHTYSNLNYRTLARLVEVVTGTPFDQYLEEKIFTPLGMDDTTSVISTRESEVFDKGHVTAYGTAIPLRAMASDVGGAGGMVSTAEDLAAFLAMIQRGGVTADGSRLLSADLVQEAMTKQEKAGTYGLGWQHTSTAHPQRVGHDGVLRRTSSRIDVVPSNGTATVVLLDSYTPAYLHPFTVSTGLVDIARGETPQVPAPVATYIDLGLLVITLVVIALAVRGVLRSRLWAERRRQKRPWRRIVRFVPLTVMPVAAIFLFLVLTIGPNSPATPVDVFGLWPAATILLLVDAIASVVVGIARLLRLRAAAIRSRASS
ncbi:MAG TPA: beta-lactamase family protein [Candidatus Yaniella excrementigallinarum]|nr:beta-lactamase family protein [Candidatus Yaniella excrementigallinarum]